MAVSRVFFLKAGYKLGSGAISKLTENAKALTKGAGILGVMVVGAMIPSYVTFEFGKIKIVWYCWSTINLRFSYP